MRGMAADFLQPKGMLLKQRVAGDQRVQILRRDPFLEAG